MEAASSSLVVYGPLGVICLVLIYAVIALYRAKEKATSECDARLEKQQLAHDAETKRLTDKYETLMERHVIKAETWVDKGNELAANLHAVLESITAKRGG